MKILYVPSRILNKFYHSKYSVLYNIYEKLNLYRLSNFKKVTFPINGELNSLGEISNVIGKENFFVLEGFHPIYYTENFQKYSKIASVNNYPSNFQYPKPNFISLNQAKDMRNNFDAIIYSTHSYHEKYYDFINSFRGKIPISLVDKFDHPEIYINSSVDIYRGIDPNFCDLFFKQDVPLENHEKKILPLGPLPCSELKNIEYSENAKYNFSFVGKYVSRTRQDRADLVLYLKKNFKNICFYDTTKNKISKSKIEELFYNTKINLSPSGIVWDSYRHTEMVNYGSPILLPKHTNKVVQPLFKDNENCILYETKIISGKWRLVDEENLFKKIKDFLNDESKRKNIFENYIKLINEGHTRYKRSKYIIDSIKKITDAKFN